MIESKKLEPYQEEALEALKELVKIPSVEKPREGVWPFGKEVNDALQYMLKLGDKLGFKTKNIENYAGHIEMGEGEEILGILVHLDVVPEGDGWKYPPYAAIEENGRLYGRGTSDNKAPAISSLYAMKALKDLGYKFNKRIRLILGTNEETGWGGITHYLKHEEEPTLSFVPDAEFPVIYAEKGILGLKINVNDIQDKPYRIVEFEGGTAGNVVPKQCKIVLEGKELEEIHEVLSNAKIPKGSELKMKFEETKLSIETQGIQCHASMPEKGLNAINVMFYALSQAPFKGKFKQFVEECNQKFGLNLHGEGLDLGYEDKETGKMTLNMGVLRLEGEKINISVDIRYPIDKTQKFMVDQIDIALKDTVFEILSYGGEDPLFVPKDSLLVENLMEVYREITLDNESGPITMGGGTYARAVKNAVAFGALFPGEEEIAHQVDEYITISKFNTTMHIYAAAIEKLAAK